MNGTIEDIRREALEILRIDYPKVKAGVLRLEVFMQTKSKKAVYELRDFLDHFAMLFREDISVEEAAKHLCECHTHLRRCAVEPLEYMAEREFVRLDRYARWCARVPIVFGFRGNPVSKPEFFQKMKEAKQHIVDGRIVKTEGKACEHMEAAFATVTELLGQISPWRYLSQGLFWLLGIACTCVITTLVVQRLSRTPQVPAAIPSAKKVATPPQAKPPSPAKSPPSPKSAPKIP